MKWFICENGHRWQAVNPGILGISCQQCGSIGETFTGDDLDTPSTQSPPSQEMPEIPGYRIVRVLGIGGMGVVYEAIQSKLNRSVALKVLKGSAAEATVNELARFRIEAEVLAKLDHPGIITVHEVGEWQNRPYFSMELVPFGSLDEQLRMRKGPLTANMAAALVEKIAEAVECAHRQNVIHRDLKPANILLAQAEGRDAWQPRVGDFGLAKRLDAVGLTQTGEIAGTPCYMAPEQILAGDKSTKEPIGPGADVYALGVILYECLTARPPFVAATTLETMKRVLEEEPVPVRRLQPTTPRDLETICMKCLRKDPAGRYGSARELAEDLKRWQRGEPIKARPVGVVERGVKWVRRNPVVSGLVAAVVMVLVVGIIGTSWGMWEAKLAATAAIKAQTEEAQGRVHAEGIAGFVRDDIFALSSVDGQIRFGTAEDQRKLSKDTTVRELLLRGAEKLKNRNDLDLRTKADLCWMLGENLRGVGEYAKAMEYSQLCVDLRREALGEEHPDTFNAWNSLALAHGFAGRTLEAIRIFELLHQRNDNQILNPSDYLILLDNLAAAYKDAGRVPEAITLFEKIHQSRVNQFGEQDNVTLTTLNNLAACYCEAGRIAQAIELLEKTHDLRVKKLGADHPDTLATLNNLALSFLAAGRLSETIKIFESISQGRKDRLGTEHPATLTSKGNLAVAYHEAARYSQAITLFEQVRAAQTKILGAEHPKTLATGVNLAGSYRAAGNAQEASNILERAILIQKENLGPDHQDILTTLENLALAKKQLNQLPEAITIFKRLQQTRAKKLGAEHPATLKTGYNLACAYSEANRFPEAISVLEVICQSQEKILGADHPSTLNTLRACEKIGGGGTESRKLARIGESKAGGADEREEQRSDNDASRHTRSERQAHSQAGFWQAESSFASA